MIYNVPPPVPLKLMSGKRLSLRTKRATSFHSRFAPDNLHPRKRHIHTSSVHVFAYTYDVYSLPPPVKLKLVSGKRLSFSWGKHQD